MEPHQGSGPGFKMLPGTTAGALNNYQSEVFLRCIHIYIYICVYIYICTVFCFFLFCYGLFELEVYMIL